MLLQMSQQPRATNHYVSACLLLPGYLHSVAVELFISAFISWFHVISMQTRFSLISNNGGSQSLEWVPGFGINS